MDERALLVVENEFSDYEHFKKLFPDWKILPESFSSIEYDTKESIKGAVIKEIKTHRKAIRAIILDVMLFGDADTYGLELIPEIRSIEDDDGPENWAQQIPIFCCSRNKDHECQRKAYKAGALNYFEKRYVFSSDANAGELYERYLFRDTLDAQVRLFEDRCLDKKINYEKIISDNIRNLEELFSSMSRGFLAEFDDMKIMFMAEFSSSQRRQEALLSTVYAGMEQRKRKKFSDTITKDISDAFGDPKAGKLKEIMESEQFSTVLKRLKEGGGFKDFIDEAFAVLDESGLSEGVPGAKILMALSKTLFKLAAS